MKRCNFILIIVIGLFFVAQNGYSQDKSQKINLLVSSRVDTSSQDVKSVLKLYENYFNSNPDSALKDNPYWNKEEKEKYTDYDFSRASLFQGQMSPKKLSKFYPPFVMSIEPIGGKYQIRVLFSSPTTKPKNAGSKVWCIQKLNAKKENHKWVLENLIVELTKKWPSKKMGFIRYSYPPKHKFNQEKALKAKNFCNDIIQRFNPSYNKPFRFYVTDNIDEMGLLENFDYYFVGSTTGKTRKNMILSALGDEYYPHEFVHQLLPKNKKQNYVIAEGLAMFLGTKTKKKDYHKRLNKLAEDLSENPEKISFKSVCSQSVRFNGYQTAYPAGAAICEVVYDKKSDKGLKKLMKADTSDYEKLINSVCEITGITEKELKEKWKNVLKKYK